MTDYIALSTGSGTGAKIATDQIAFGATSLDFQRFKIVIGTTGTAEDVHAGNPIPVTVSGGPITITGDVVAKVSGNVTVVVSGTAVVQVSGSVTVSGAVDVSSMPANTTSSGSITAVGQTVTITVPSGGSSVGLQISGTWTGQLEFEGTVDGTNYVSVFASNNTGDSVNSAAGNGVFILPGAGFQTIRVRASAFSSGTADIDFNASIGGAGSRLTQAIPTGTNTIGAVNVSGAVTVSGLRADRGAFTKATSLIIPIGGYFGTGGLTASGQVGIIRTSSQGILFIAPSGTSLPVKVSGTVAIAEPITVSGTVMVTPTGTALPVVVSGGLTVPADDSAYAPGSDEVFPVGGVWFGSTIQNVSTCGDLGVFRMTSGRVLLVTGISPAGATAVQISDWTATGTVVTKVSGSVTVNTATGPFAVTGGPVMVKATGTSLAVKVSGTVAVAEPITISGTITDITNTIVAAISGNVIVDIGKTPSTGGPIVATKTASGAASLVTGKAGESYYITAIHISNSSGKLDVAVGPCGIGGSASGTKYLRGTYASAGGGVVMPYNPAVKVPATGAIYGWLSAAGSVTITIQTYRQ